MNASSVDIKDILETVSGLGLTAGTDLFVGREPETPDNTVTIFDVPGGSPLLTLAGKGGGDLFYPSIQIRVRNNSYVVGYDLIQDIRTELHGLNNVVKNGTTYLLIKSVDDPFLLDWDDNSRARFVATFEIIRR